MRNYPSLENRCQRLGSGSWLIEELYVHEGYISPTCGEVSAEFAQGSNFLRLKLNVDYREQSQNFLQSSKTDREQRAGLPGELFIAVTPNSFCQQELKAEETNASLNGKGWDPIIHLYLQRRRRDDAERGMG